MLGLALAAAGCSAEPGGAEGAVPPPSTRALTAAPAPPVEPPSGRLLADLRQSSRDAALDRFQVWVGNDTRTEVVPTRLTYRDGRLRAPIEAERLRPVPAGSERGYPLALPARPRCGARPARPTLVVEHGDARTTVPVDDPVDVVGQWVRRRCLQQTVAEVATLRWDDRVVAPADRPVAPGDTATLTLVVTPSGVPGGRLLVRTVGGTPVLSPADGTSAWSPGKLLRSDGPAVRLELPVQPTRCDAHAFLESGGATAFRVRVRVDPAGEEPEDGELVVRMAPRGAAAAIAFAVASCGLADG
ncbi:hypothetical protein [Nocardioides sp. SYSU DS0663]|uniref:hypothetical protein n=1 Tax=Nocardioides sp. SYSU DS0663 TaxID=3416445 RepID=UPI003F4B5F97